MSAKTLSILIYCQIYDFFDPSTFFDDTRKLLKTVVIEFFFDQNTRFSKIPGNKYPWKRGTSLGSGSWGKCQLGEVPVGGITSLGMYQLRELNLSNIPSTFFIFTHFYKLISTNEDYVFFNDFFYIFINSYNSLRVRKRGPFNSCRSHFSTQSPHWHTTQLTLPQTITSSNWYFLQLAPPPTGTFCNFLCRYTPESNRNSSFSNMS